ncbi:MAG: hypothetical protein E7643_03650 [Ruminococcaceae bacterium]|nr:hypothetical protein [Oscillospiraceae bacterium]
MLKGIVVYMLTGVGSQSEGVYPFLYVGNNVYKRIWLEEDGSLMGNALLPYDGKTVELVGDYDVYGIFCIREIKVLFDMDFKTENKH